MTKKDLFAMILMYILGLIVYGLFAFRIFQAT